MTCRNVSALLDNIREQTGNSEYAVSAGVFTEGISHNLILEALNDAQDHLQAAIITAYPDEFTATRTIPMVANQENYAINDNVFLNNKLLDMQFSSDSSLREYAPLPQRTIRDRRTFTSAVPSYYIRRGGEILFNPIPLSTRGSARVTYYRELDDLDIRRGKIASKTTTTIVLVNDSTLDPANLTNAEYVCTVDSHGTVKDYSVVVSSYNSGTFTLTIPTTTLTAAANDYVVIGKFATTHSALPINCERYLKTYAKKRVYDTDSSDDSMREDPELKAMLNTILENYAEMSQDVVEIPVIDEYLEL